MQACNWLETVHSRSNFHVFSRYHAGFPCLSQAELLLREFTPLMGKAVGRGKVRLLVQQCYRTDLCREAAAQIGLACPDNDYKVEGEHPQPWRLSEQIELGSDLMLGAPAECIK